ncbi:transcriptional regulator [Pseudooceanicola sp. 216_PA32_1]|uniref:Transcriptional regulator n=1 Tax=Pseudooceanicola pacificus TaxID=2676438 RepID=A0A844WAR7_9RHOB|nr:helix-turn-helix domain-containing protein [Pseudooceanicola pacificus]MWB77788.1 transcriptional regulator [Pseudooceanicola pacificus]
MAGKRRYEDGCAFAQSLDLVGERWALLVVRELIFGPKRFTDLKSDLPGIATNVLSQRMADLEEAAIVVKRELPPPGRATVYELTDWGRDLAPIFKVMGRWAARSPHLKHDWPMSVNAALLSLGAMFRPGRAKGFEAVIEMHLSDRPFTVSVLGKQLAVEPGVPRAPDVTLRCDQNLLLSVLHRGHPLDAAEAEGMQVTGDRSVLEQFAGFFPMPKPAPGRAA